MKFTLRKSGYYMTTMRTTHYLGSVDIAKALCRFGSAGFGVDGPSEDGQPGEEITATQFKTFLREVVRSWGMDAYQSDSAWDENYTDDDAERVAVWAAAQIRRLQPKLDDEPLRKWLANYTGDAT